MLLEEMHKLTSSGPKFFFSKFPHFAWLLKTFARGWSIFWIEIILLKSWLKVQSQTFPKVQN